MNDHQKLLDLVNERLNRSQPLTLNDFDTAFSDLGIDSLDRMLVFVAVQEKFGVQIPDEQATELTNMQKLSQWLQDNVS